VKTSGFQCAPSSSAWVANLMRMCQLYVVSEIPTRAFAVMLPRAVPFIGREHVAGPFVGTARPSQISPAVFKQSGREDFRRQSAVSPVQCIGPALGKRPGIAARG